MPLMDKFVGIDAIALITSDDGRTYMNIAEHYDVNHETVQHNRRFVDPERVAH